MRACFAVVCHFSKTNARWTAGALSAQGRTWHTYNTSLEIDKGRVSKLANQVELKKTLSSVSGVCN